MPSTLESSKSLLVISTPTCSRSSKKNGKGQTDGEGQFFHRVSLRRNVWDSRYVGY